MIVSQVFVSIGSNIERENNIRSAVQVLRESFGALQLSSVYETEAVGFDGDPFYNLVVGFTVPDVSLPDEKKVKQVMGKLRDIEAAHGRVRNNAKFSARTLDLDLLLFDNLDLRAQGLDLPREEITRYAFVLGPLAEIAPELAHPLLNQSYSELWSAYKLDNPQRSEAMRMVTFPW